ncbi:MAG: ABC transporter ATP-binding protein [Myxococcota bacterium]
MTGASAIELIGLRKEFPDRQKTVVAVAGLDLTVRRGEVFGLLGPNGAGKTTTVEICEGLQRPSSGTVRVLGHTWNGGDAGDVRQRIGVSLQETRFFDKQTVRELLELFRAFYVSGRTAEEAIELVGLENKAETRSAKLSGGQRQRLAGATALVGNPELLFLDEPTTGLDPASRRGLWDVIQSFRSGGGTVLLTTHYMEEAEQLCDRVGVMDQGKLVALDTPKGLVRSLDGGYVVRVEASEFGDAVESDVREHVPGIRRLHRSDGRLSLTVDAPHEAVPALIALLEKHQVRMSDLHTHHTSLDDVFIHLTGRSFEEADG